MGDQGACMGDQDFEAFTHDHQVRRVHAWVRGGGPPWAGTKGRDFEALIHDHQVGRVHAWVRGGHPPTAGRPMCACVHCLRRAGGTPRHGHHMIAGVGGCHGSQPHCSSSRARWVCLGLAGAELWRHACCVALSS